MLYYKCTTNGGKMKKIHRFCPRTLEKILVHVHPDHALAFNEVGDKYVATSEISNNAVISVTHDERTGYVKSYVNYPSPQFPIEKTEILLEEEGCDKIKITYEPHSGQKIDFTIRVAYFEDEITTVEKKIVILETI